MRRNRIIYLTMAIIVIILGLITRKASDMPSLIKLYSGDISWGLMAFIFNKKSTLHIAIYSIIFSFGIELSQLYHAPWIDGIRNTTLGGLILGFSFLYSDLLCYTLGIGVGIVLDKIIYLKSFKI